MNDAAEVLTFDGVSKSFASPGARGGRVLAVDDVSFSVRRGQTLCVIGESGSGKSTVARLALGLLDSDSGHITYDGIDLKTCGRSRLREVRATIGTVFQEPYESLNPRLTVRRCVADPLLSTSLGRARPERMDIVDRALASVGLPARLGDRYPGELSGGQQQRVALARALVLEPRLLILDEATSALDLSVQAQILELLVRLREERGLSYLFITHNIDVASFLADEIVVMRNGRVVERGEPTQVLTEPAHEYTAELLASTLRLS